MSDAFGPSTTGIPAAQRDQDTQLPPEYFIEARASQGLPSVIDVQEARGWVAEDLAQLNEVGADGMPRALAAIARNIRSRPAYYDELRAADLEVLTKADSINSEVAHKDPAGFELLCQLELRWMEQADLDGSVYDALERAQHDYRTIQALDAPELIAAAAIVMNDSCDAWPSYAQAVQDLRLVELDPILAPLIDASHTRRWSVEAQIAAAGRWSPEDATFLAEKDIASFLKAMQEGRQDWMHHYAGEMGLHGINNATYRRTYEKHAGIASEVEAAMEPRERRMMAEKEDRKVDALPSEWTSIQTAAHARRDSTSWSLAQPGAERNNFTASIARRMTQNESYADEVRKIEPAAAAAAVAFNKRASPETSLDDLIRLGGPVEMASLPGHRMVYSDEVGWPGPRIINPDDTVTQFGGAVALDKYITEFKVHDVDAKVLRAFIERADLDTSRFRNSSKDHDSMSTADQQEKNTALAQSVLEEAKTFTPAQARDRFANDLDEARAGTLPENGLAMIALRARASLDYRNELEQQSPQLAKDAKAAIEIGSWLPKADWATAKEFGGPDGRVYIPKGMAEYAGKVVLVTDTHIVQKVSKTAVIAHDIKKLSNGAALAALDKTGRPTAIGKELLVEYGLGNGTGQVKTFEQVRAQEVKEIGEKYAETAFKTPAQKTTFLKHLNLMFEKMSKESASRDLPPAEQRPQQQRSDRAR